MTTAELKAETLRQAATEMQHANRTLSLTTIAEEQGAALERAGELALAGLWHQSRFVAMQGRAS